MPETSPTEPLRETTQGLFRQHLRTGTIRIKRQTKGVGIMGRCNLDMKSLGQHLLGYESDVPRYPRKHMTVPRS
jgi:hypothetical protein